MPISSKDVTARRAFGFGLRSLLYDPKMLDGIEPRDDGAG